MINLSVPKTSETPEMKPRITVVGVGGAGGNAVNNMIDSHLEGVDFIVANTDAQALVGSRTERRLQLGRTVTQGLGAGSRPDVGRTAAEEAQDEIAEAIRGSNMAFIAAGMGGGTGTGAAPVVARIARELGILTVGVVTKPFQFEGVHRMRVADAGIEELEKYVDTLIIIPNQNLFRIANEKTTFAEAFKMADEVLYSGVRGVTDLMVMPGLINLDFADVRSVMSEMGKAMMGTGEAEGERRALDAAEAAINNPLLDDTSMKGARGVLINITGGMDMTLFEVDEAANRIRSEVDEDAYIIFGSAFDASLEGRVRVSVVATGINGTAAVRTVPAAINIMVDRPAVKRLVKTEPAKPEAAKPVPARPEPIRAPAATTVAAPQPQPQAIEQMELEPVIRKAAQAAEATATALSAVNPAPAATVMQPPAGLNAAASALLSFEDAPTVVPAAEAVVYAPAPTPAAAVAMDVPAPEVIAEPAAPVGFKPTAGPGALDAFIPPPPVEPSGRSPIRPEPFAAAAVLNAGRQARAEEPRKLTIFEKVIGLGRARAKPTMQPAAAAHVAPAAAKETPTPDESAQQRLGGLDPTDRIGGASDDDLLDIPAFLRRQAN